MRRSSILKATEEKKSLCVFRTIPHFRGYIELTQFRVRSRGRQMNVLFAAVQVRILLMSVSDG